MKTVRRYRRTRRWVKYSAVVLTLGLALVLSGCSWDKAAEPFNDAPRGHENSGPADVITMPDGFSNVATKCDHGNRVYVVFKQDNPYGSISVVKDDPTCP